MARDWNSYGTVSHSRVTMVVAPVVWQAIGLSCSNTFEHVICNRLLNFIDKQISARISYKTLKKCIVYQQCLFSVYRCNEVQIIIFSLIKDSLWSKPGS